MTDDQSLLPGTHRALYHRTATAQATGRAPAVAAAVVRDGTLVWTGAHGAYPAGEDRQYRIGSITKTFTAVLVLRLRDAGLLDLGDRLAAHLPGTPYGGDATIAQLLSHSAGLAAEARGPWWERTEGTLRPQLADLFGPDAQKHPAGRGHHYSNPGYALLGALVERLRGAPWTEVLDTEILQPLGMTRTTALPQPPYAPGWAVHPHADVLQPEPLTDTGRMAPAGQLWSTPGDLAAFARFLLAGDDAVLGADTLAEMRTPAVAPADPGGEAGYGLGLQIIRSGGRVLTGHTGSMPGFTAALWTSPADRLAALAFANATSGVPTGALAAELLAEVADREPTVPEPWRPMPAADAEPWLVALTGTWYWGTGAYTLRLLAGRTLVLTPAGGAGRGSRFRPVPGDERRWRGLEGYYAGEILHAVPDGPAPHLDLGTFVFTRIPYDPDAPTPGGGDPAGWTGR
ncbi:serine hydrolase domain-containing protein [Streptomyces harbinensis]|uniref:serine hydrolase domain-containing protein n=1 Tax=Streptomyces harbinensis TaxID=1176198 RepID=UPI003395B213